MATRRIVEHKVSGEFDIMEGDLILAVCDDPLVAHKIVGALANYEAALDERALFEKWVSDQEPGYALSNLRRSSSGNTYQVHRVAMWWFAWQSRAALAANATPAQPECDCDRRILPHLPHAIGCPLAPEAPLTPPAQRHPAAHKPWCASIPRPMDGPMDRGPFKCDCHSWDPAAPLSQDAQKETAPPEYQIDIDAVKAQESAAMAKNFRVQSSEKPPAEKWTPFQEWWVVSEHESDSGGKWWADTGWNAALAAVEEWARKSTPNHGAPLLDELQRLRGEGE